MADIIRHFRGEYSFLSNFYKCKVSYGAYQYDNSEAAYQASKTKDLTEKEKFMCMSPKDAKRYGRRVTMYEGFEENKVKIMQEIVFCKFMENKDLMKKLQDTGDAKLIEGNKWHDNFWGVCDCPRQTCNGGKNILGKILMQVRDLYRKDPAMCERIYKDILYKSLED